MRTFVVLLALYSVFASVEETDKDCGAYETCLKQENCPSFLEKSNQFKRLSRGLQKSKLRTELREAVCNKKKKAVCCPSSEETDKNCGSGETCLKKEDCPSFLEIYNQYSNLRKGSEKSNLETELREAVCNKREKAVCCPRQTKVRFQTATTTTTRQSDMSNSESSEKFLSRLGSCGVSTTPASSVVGGEDTRPGDFPFAALVGYEVEKTTASYQGRPSKKYKETKWSCSGTLINRWYVLTAAHCQGKTAATKISKLRLGEWEVEGYGGGGKPDDPNVQKLPDEQDFDIIEYDVTVHEDYKTVYENSRKNVVNDIALIKLPRPATINNAVQIACLPFITQEFERYLSIADVVSGLVGRNTTVVGWGKTDADQLVSWDGVGSRKQQKLKLPILSKEQCKKKNKQFVHRDSQICAGGELGRDSCRGDSGGGLFIHNENEKQKNTPWYLVGIVSFGSRDCGNGGAGVYTRVSSFIPWIEKNLK
eukprot:GFUD01093474.1.p1 GENE.GFUD01093474.1~~GFUD01093474.1.p1  ORF type:complete len:480 (-),score=113.09 GFUD01093474.1:19-1458(-)